MTNTVLHPNVNIRSYSLFLTLHYNGTFFYDTALFTIYSHRMLRFSVLETITHTVMCVKRYGLRYACGRTT